MATSELTAKPKSNGRSVDRSINSSAAGEGQRLTVQGKGLVPTFLLCESVAAAPCSGRCPETPVQLSRRASLDVEGVSIANRYRSWRVASANILSTDLAESLGKKRPRCSKVPAVCMGRMAMDQDFKGKGLCVALLADALRRAFTTEIAVYAFVVVPRMKGPGLPSIDH